MATTKPDRAELVKWARGGRSRLTRDRARALLRFRDGYAIPDIAEELSRQESTVKRWISMLDADIREVLRQPPGRPPAHTWSLVDRVVADFRRNPSVRAVSRNLAQPRTTVARVLDTMGVDIATERNLSPPLSDLASRVCSVLGVYIEAVSALLVVLAYRDDAHPPPPLRRKRLADRPGHIRAAERLRDLPTELRNGAGMPESEWGRLASLPHRFESETHRICSVIALTDDGEPMESSPDDIRRGFYLVDPREWEALSTRVVSALRRRQDGRAEVLASEINSFGSTRSRAGKAQPFAMNWLETHLD